MPTVRHIVERRVARRPKGQAALTLTEMLVVIAVFGMLASLLIPALVRTRSRARMVVCANNLKGLGQAYTICLTESSGYMSDAYYTFEQGDTGYLVALKTPEADQPADFFKYGQSDILTCPADRSPVSVLAASARGAALACPASYAYNISLPLLFKNAARVRQPVNTVTFYDGNAQAVVGTWKHELGWAENSVRHRHIKQANFLYLDGHVEPSSQFPDLAFEGGGQALAWLDGDGDTGGGDDGDDGDDDEDDDVDFDIDDGEVVPDEPCTATITCIGSEYWPFGMHRPRVPVQSHYSLNSSSWIRIAADSRPGDQVVLQDVDAGDRIAIMAKTTRYICRGPYASNDGSGHCWLMVDGDIVPSVAGAMGQAGIEVFLEPYMDESGHLTLGPNDIICLFEMSPYIDYHKYSAADFQDLVMLITLSRTTE